MPRAFARIPACVFAALLTLVSGFFLSVLAAAPPVNDTCAGALIIPRSGPFPHLTPVVDATAATVAASDPLPSNPFLIPGVTRSVWYQFTPAAAGSYTLSTCSDAGSATTVNDTVLGVYTSVAGCLGPFTWVGEGDEECGPSGSQASVSLTLSADTTYYAVVWKFCDGCVEDGMNQVQLVVTGTTVATNDTCAGVVPVQLGLPVTGTTIGAADNFRLSGTNAFGGLDQFPSTAEGRDVVFSFTAPSAGEYSFKALGYSINQDLVIYVLTNCPAGAGPTVLTNALAASNRSRVNSAEEITCLALVAQQRVFVVVDDSQALNVGSPFALEVVRCTPEREPNDLLTTATPIASGIVGSISPQGDIDNYSLGRYPAGYRVFALVDGEAARNAAFELRVMTPTATLEYDTDDNDSFFGDSAPNIAGTPLTGEPVYLRVNYDGDLRSAEPYRLYAVVQPPIEQAAREVEPNNEITQANADASGYFYGVLQGPGKSTDVDVYVFNVSEGDLIYLSLDGDPHRTNSPVNARLELLDASGNLVLAVNDPNSTSLTNGLISMFPASPAEGILYRSAVEGAFYARVSISPTASGQAASGDYLLSITKNCSVGQTGLPHAPVLTNLVLSAPVTAGFPATLTGTIWQLDTGNPSQVTVLWGDGTTNLLDFAESGVIDFSVAHVFAAANTNQTVTVTVRDRVGNKATGTRSFPVRPHPGSARFVGITPLPSGRLHLELEGTPGAFYRIERGDALGHWTEIGSQGADASGRLTFDDPTPGPAAQFYRAVGKP